MTIVLKSEKKGQSSFETERKIRKQERTQEKRIAIG